MSEWITEVSESDTRTSYPVSEIVWKGKTKACDSVILADSPVFGRMLFLDGELQSAAVDEHIYHEALVHPAMAGAGTHQRVLVVGGGEGATVREVLRWAPDLVDWVDIDEELVELCTEHLQWAPHIFRNPLVHYHAADIRTVLPSLGLYNVIILDLPDPDGETGYLYSEAFWYDIMGHLAIDGRLVTHCGPVRPFGRIGEGFQRIRSTLVSADLPIMKNNFYSQMIPSFQSEWGFLLFIYSDSEEPFDYLEEEVYLSANLRTVDRRQLIAWANPTKLWRNALRSIQTI
jgi:spermidine synthase